MYYFFYYVHFVCSFSTVHNGLSLFKVTDSSLGSNMEWLAFFFFSSVFLCSLFCCVSLFAPKPVTHLFAFYICLVYRFHFVCMHGNDTNLIKKQRILNETVQCEHKMQHKVFNETFMVVWYSVKMYTHKTNMKKEIREKSAHFSCHCIAMKRHQLSYSRDGRETKCRAHFCTS